MTLFLTASTPSLPASGTLPPARHPVGASDIGFLSERRVHATIEQVGKAWLDGHEVGTHFNGHFCGTNGVSRWSPRDWDSEIDQAVAFVQNWRTTPASPTWRRCPSTTPRSSSAAAPRALKASATCYAPAGPGRWRYDSSAPEPRSGRPARGRFVDLPTAGHSVPGHRFEVLSMDYNMMANQSVGPNGDPRDAPPGGPRPATPSSPDSAAPTTPTAHPCSSATTSSAGTAASTWPPSRTHSGRWRSTPTCGSCPSASSSTGSRRRTQGSWWAAGTGRGATATARLGRAHQLSTGP